MKDKLGDKAGDKRKTRPARRTQHPIQGWHTKKALRTPAVNCLKEKRYADTHFASLLATLSLQDNDSQWPWPRDQKMLQKRGRMVPRLTLCSLCCLYCPYALPPLPLTSWCYETVTQMPFVLGWLHWLYIVCWIIESCHQESNVAMLVCNVDTADKSVTQCDRWQDVMMWSNVTLCSTFRHCQTLKLGCIAATSNGLTTLSPLLTRSRPLAALCDPNTESDFHVASKQLIQTDSVLQSASKETFKVAFDTCHMTHPGDLEIDWRSEEAHALSRNRQLPAVPPSRRKPSMKQWTWKKQGRKRTHGKIQKMLYWINRIRMDSHFKLSFKQLLLLQLRREKRAECIWNTSGATWAVAISVWDSSLVFLCTLIYTLYALCIQIIATWHVSMWAKCSEWWYGFQLVQWPHVVLRPLCTKSVLAILAPLREAPDMWHLALNFLFHNSNAQAAWFLWQHAGLLVIKRLTPRRSGIAVTWLGNPSGVKMTGWQNDAKNAIAQNSKICFLGLANF